MPRGDPLVIGMSNILKWRRGCRAGFSMHAGLAQRSWKLGHIAVERGGSDHVPPSGYGIALIHSPSWSRYDR